MRLKKLSLFGFKSFAHKITLDFEGNVIAIVGPNGCGKSNIVDAFRWVMGELSAKSLRGNTLEDLLFVGSSTTSPCHFAEVSVHLTDVGNALPLEFDEVVLTRKVHRNGESEVFINKTPARLKDIQNLLLGTGLGKGAFSIFEQGKLDAIIYKNPLERRLFFEECAGTICFSQQKKETLKKLKEVALNCERLEDLKDEVKKQLHALKRASKVAQNYQSNQEALQELEKNIVLALFFEAQEKENKQEQEINKLVEKQERVEKTLLALQTELSAQEEQEENSQQEFAKVNQAYLANKSALQLHEGEINNLKKKEDELKAALKRVEAERLAGEKGGLELQKQQQEHHQKAEAALLTKKELEEKLQVTKERFDKREGALQTQREMIKRGRETLEKRAKEAAHFQEEEHRLQAELEGVFQRIDLLRQGVIDKKEVVKELRAKSQEKGNKLNALNKDIAKMALQEKEDHAALATLKEKISALEESQAKLMQQLSDKRARKKSLLALQEEFEGFSSGAKKLLATTQKKTSPLYGRLSALYEELKPKKGYAKAFSASLRPYSQTLVVQNADDVALVMEFAQKEGIADFSLVCKERLPQASTPLPLAESSPLATHFLHHVEVEKDLKTALNNKEADGALVTEEGEFIDTKHVIFKGGAKETNTFTRQALLEAIVEDIEKLQEKKEVLISKLQTLKMALLSQEKQHQERKDALRFKEMSKAQVSFTLERYEADVALGQSDIEKIEKEMAQLETAYEKKREQLEDAKTNTLKALDLRKRLQQQQDEGESAFEKLLQEHSGIKEEYLKQQETFRGALETWQQEDRNYHVLKAKREASALRNARLDKEFVALQEALQKGKKECEALQSKQQTKGAQLQKVAVHKEALQQSLKGHKDALNTLKERLHKEQLDKERLFGQRKEKEVVQARISTQKQELQKELETRFSLSLPEVHECTFDFSTFKVSEAKQQIATLRQEIEKAGAVNLAAIEECKEVEDRYNKLDEELKDIQEAKQELEAFIANVDRESRKLFKKTFKEVREAFLKNFALLFNGGEADLSLVGSADILEAGIEISAQPPGKKMRSIGLLSGGEKCLTAVALLFAFFEVKPAPFCILDEVDAPLDEANVARFTTLLKQFISKTQFIIVTHNKKTMAEADLLYGVSMEEKGVSKLISLRFEKATRDPKTEVDQCISASPKKLKTTSTA